MSEKELIAANQTAIKELGKEIREIKEKQDRDMKDQWQMIDELRRKCFHDND